MYADYINTNMYFDFNLVFNRLLRKLYNNIIEYNLIKKSLEANLE